MHKKLTYKLKKIYKKRCLASQRNSVNVIFKYELQNICKEKSITSYNIGNMGIKLTCFQIFFHCIKVQIYNFLFTFFR